MKKITFLDDFPFAPLNKRKLGNIFVMWIDSGVAYLERNQCKNLENWQMKEKRV